MLDQPRETARKIIYQKFEDYCKELTGIDSNYLASTYPYVAIELQAYLRGDSLPEWSILVNEALIMNIPLSSYIDIIQSRTMYISKNIGANRGRLWNYIRELESVETEDQVQFIARNAEFMDV